MAIDWRDKLFSVGDLVVYADRVHVFSGCDEAWVLFRALTEDYRAWWPLHPGEVPSDVLEATEPTRVVWSSPWPVSPKDQIEFLIDRAPGGLSVRVRWLTDAPPDERGVAITRQRLNMKLGSYLRGWLLYDLSARPANVPLPSDLPDPDLSWMRQHFPGWLRPTR